MTRFGILSTARINRRILEGAAGSDLVEVVAVGSRDGARAGEYAREHGIARAHGSYEALLADPDVDAIYISLPNGLHREWSIRALEAGKHVLCEKPMSSRPAEVGEVFDIAAARGLCCMEAFMWRHHEQTRRLQELLAAGTIGELRLIRAAFSFPLSDPANVRLDPALDGGALMDLGCYCISAIRLLGGEPESVAARHVLTERGVDIRTSATLALPGGALGAFQCGMDMLDRSELELIGSAGTITARDPWHGRRPLVRVQTADGDDEIECRADDPYRLELEDLHRAIRGEGTQLIGREDALGQARAIELVRAAASAA
jgi:predicted dehydrogenase